MAYHLHHLCLASVQLLPQTPRVCRLPIPVPPPGVAVPPPRLAFAAERCGRRSGQEAGSGGGTAAGERSPGGGQPLAASGRCGPVEVPRQPRRVGLRARRREHPRPPGALRISRGTCEAAGKASPVLPAGSSLWPEINDRMK